MEDGPPSLAMASRVLMELETALLQIIDIVDEFSIQEERKATLTPAKFKELDQQLPHFMKNVGDLDEKMRSLDVELEYGEYWRLLGELVMEIKREEVGKKK